MEACPSEAGQPSAPEFGFTVAHNAISNTVSKQPLPHEQGYRKEMSMSQKIPG